MDRRGFLKGIAAAAAVVLVPFPSMAARPKVVPFYGDKTGYLPRLNQRSGPFGSPYRRILASAQDRLVESYAMMRLCCSTNSRNWGGAPGTWLCEHAHWQTGKSTEWIEWDFYEFCYMREGWDSLLPYRRMDFNRVFNMEGQPMK